MKISYAITVCNEAQEFRRLLNFLVPNIREEDEIVVLQDTSKASKEVNRVFIDFADYIENRMTCIFPGNFADWKNMLNDHCHGDFIFQLDADEFMDPETIGEIPVILEMNPEVDLYWIPRVNTVEGLTEEDIQKWHWRVNEQGWVNWPDYQGRIYRNSPGIRWEGKVHEKIVGAKLYAYLPDTIHLYHPKTIDKQRQQNSLYERMQ